MTEPAFRVVTVDDAPALVALRLANREHFQIAEPRQPEVFFTLERQRGLIAGAEGLMLGAFAGDELIGFARLSNVVLGAFHNAYLGYMVGRDHNGRGVGTLLVRHAVQLAWDRRLHRVQAAVRTDNPASLRVMEKAGFRREGLALRYLNLDGEWRDHVLHAITREDPFEPPG
ncbi:MAG TPA: GNAT family protein [Solirubrobacteraceae bacterium]|nr:GNAT family protein [Solirubrobacteraceae bacterium]